MRKFIVSGRFFQKIPYKSDLQYVSRIARRYKLPIDRIDSVFGFIDEYAPLYGGRVWNKADSGISVKKIEAMNRFGIGFGLAMSNKFFNDEAYEVSKKVIEMMPKSDLNYIIITNDTLSRKVREDFPDMHQKLSCIAEVDNVEEIYKKLELYDIVTLHVDQNLRDEFLRLIPESIKSKIVLFGIGQCATYCRHKICYTSVSLSNLKQKHNCISCIKKLDEKNGKEPLDVPFHVPFDLRDSRFDGFEIFKLPAPAKDMVKLLGVVA